MAYVSVDVDVDIDMFDDDELIDYLEGRGYKCIKMAGSDDWTKDLDYIEDELSNLYQQYRNNHPALMETLRTYLMNATGRVLP